LVSVLPFPRDLSSGLEAAIVNARVRCDEPIRVGGVPQAPTEILEERFFFLRGTADGW
jgi:hypothetical protein